eukprot:6036921-Pyramimonas_sp.AAC.1
MWGRDEPVSTHTAGKRGAVVRALDGKGDVEIQRGLYRRWRQHIILKNTVVFFNMKRVIWEAKDMEPQDTVSQTNDLYIKVILQVRRRIRKRVLTFIAKVFSVWEAMKPPPPQEDRPAGLDETRQGKANVATT